MYVCMYVYIYIYLCTHYNAIITDVTLHRWLSAAAPTRARSAAAPINLNLIIIIISIGCKRIAAMIMIIITHRILIFINCYYCYD